jgi:hypothetical protein
MSENHDEVTPNHPPFWRMKTLTMLSFQGLRLRQPQIDIVTAAQAGILGLPDPSVLAHAADDDRILLSHDKRTMPDHFAAFLMEGNQSPGVMLISRKAPIGQVIEALLLVWGASSHGEWRNVIARLPF